MRVRWSALGGQLGIGLAVVGFVVVFLGWNGAASYDRVPAQFPYLISGGVAGLCLVMLGAAAIVVQNQRTDRALLEDRLAELQRAVELLARASTVNGSAARARGDVVLAGESSFHRPDCHLLEGRDGLAQLRVSEAEAAGLTPCRVCAPGASAAPTVTVPARKAARAVKTTKTTKKSAARTRSAR